MRKAGILLLLLLGGSSLFAQDAGSVKRRMEEIGARYGIYFVYDPQLLAGVEAQVAPPPLGKGAPAGLEGVVRGDGGRLDGEAALCRPDPGRTAARPRK